MAPNRRLLVGLETGSASSPLSQNQGSGGTSYRNIMFIFLNFSAKAGDGFDKPKKLSPQAVWRPACFRGVLRAVWCASRLARANWGTLGSMQSGESVDDVLEGIIQELVTTTRALVEAPPGRPLDSAQRGRPVAALERLFSLVRSPGAMIAPLARKVLTPALFVLRLPRGRAPLPLGALELALRCVHGVLRRVGPAGGCRLFVDVYMAVIPHLGGGIDGDKGSVFDHSTSASREELQGLAVDCIHALLRHVAAARVPEARRGPIDDSGVSELLRSVNFLPALGRGVSGLLDACAAGGGPRAVRLAALSGLGRLLDALGEVRPSPSMHPVQRDAGNAPDAKTRAADPVASFFPGIIGGLSKVLCGHARQGKDVFAAALRVWGRVIASVLADQGASSTNAYHSSDVQGQSQQTFAQARQTLATLLSRGRRVAAASQTNENDRAQKVSSSTRGDISQGGVATLEASRLDADWVYQAQTRMRPLINRVHSRLQTLDPESLPEVWAQMVDTYALLLSRCTAALGERNSNDMMDALVSSTVHPNSTLRTRANVAVKSLLGQLRGPAGARIAAAAESSLSASLRALPRKLRGAVGLAALPAIRAVEGYLCAVAAAGRGEGTRLGYWLLGGGVRPSALARAALPLLASLEIDVEDAGVVEHASGPHTPYHQTRLLYARADAMRDALLRVPRAIGASVGPGQVETVVERLLGLAFRPRTARMVTAAAEDAGMGAPPEALMLPRYRPEALLCAIHVLKGAVGRWAQKESKQDSQKRKPSSVASARPSSPGHQGVVGAAERLLGTCLTVLARRKRTQHQRQDAESGKAAGVAAAGPSYIGGRALAMRTLALRGIAGAAAAMGRAFRRHLMNVLYPVLESAGGTDPAERRAGTATLERVAQCCGYTGVTELTLENADYLVDEVASRLRVLAVGLRRGVRGQGKAAPHAGAIGRVVEALLAHTRDTGALIAMLRDTLTSVTSSLELVAAAGGGTAGVSDATLVYMRVLNGVVAAVRRAGEAGGAAATTSATLSQTQRAESRVDEERRRGGGGVVTRLRQYAVEQSRLSALEAYPPGDHPEDGSDSADTPVSWSSKGLSMQEREILYKMEDAKRARQAKGGRDDTKGTDTDGGVATAKGEATPKPKPPPEVDLVVGILTSCRHFLTRREQPRLVRLALSVLGNAAFALRPYENKLLPVAAQVWGDVTPHLWPKRDSVGAIRPGRTPLLLKSNQSQLTAMSIGVFCAALEALEALGTACPGFLRQRFSRDAWPGLKRTLQRAAVAASACLSRQGYLTSPGFRAEVAILRCLGGLLERAPELMKPVLGDVCSMAIHYAAGAHPETLVSAGARVVRAAWGSDADLVWYQLTRQLLEVQRRSERAPDGEPSAGAQRDAMDKLKMLLAEVAKVSEQPFYV